MSGKTSIEWAGVPGFPGYTVTPDGRIRGIAFIERDLKQTTAKSGHRYVIARVEGHGRKLFIHRAILLAFVGPCPEGMEARHLDGDPTNNTIANLAWGTRQENAEDARKHGRVRAARRKTGRLTSLEVAVIRQRIGKAPLRAIAAEFGVSHTTVRGIATGRLWS